MQESFWLSRAEVRELDKCAIEEYGVPGIVLMENAGRGVAELLLRLDPDLTGVTTVCGRGNNGGDGFVIARHLENLGVHVSLIVVAENVSDIVGDARINYDIAVKAGISMQQFWLQPVSTSLFSESDWIVDALFGTGLDRPLGPQHRLHGTPGLGFGLR